MGQLTTRQWDANDSPGNWIRYLLVAAALVSCNGQDKVPVAPAVSGDLSVTVRGLPPGAAARITLAGPAGFTRTLSASTQVSGIGPGTYTVSALYVSSGGIIYLPTVSSASVEVTAGTVAADTVSYASGPAPTLNLTVAGVQLIQSSQRSDNSVPMVAGRDAMLRVFVVGSEANRVAPNVRVWLYSGSALVDSITVAAPSTSVPLQVDTATYLSSWNVLIPAARVQPGLAILAQADPADSVPELDKSDDRWPPNGVPAAVQVLAVAPFHLRFVPVTQGGLTGNVSNANKEQLLVLARSMYPLAGYDIDVRAPYTSGAGPLQANDSNGAWGTILSEVAALRATDGSTRNYYGVVATNYNSGYAGLGYIGAPTAIGWDKGSSVANVVTHELGHNFGRLHAPCGVSPSDASYPYLNAQIGQWGLDLPNLVLKSPTGFKDIMSYCSPDWVSDYTYEAVLNFRGAGPAVLPAAATPSGPGLLVWGRIRRDSIIMEPAFNVIAPALLPTRPGSHRLSGVTASGTALFDFGFDGDSVADLPGGWEEQFAFVVPLDSAGAAELSSVRLNANGRTIVRDAAGAGPLLSLGAASVAATRAAPDEVELRWDPLFPMALVRDGGTGDILSFARGGVVRVHTTAVQLRVDLSGGLRSLGRTVTVPIR